MGKHIARGSSGVADPASLGTGSPDGTKFLRGDGTWQVPSGGGGLTHESILQTPARPPSTTAVTNCATNTSYFVYLGRVSSAVTTADIVVRVHTAAVTITWAEVGIFKGSPVANGAASLTRCGFTNVAAVFNSTGVKKVTVALSGVQAGDELWLAYGQQATTLFQLRGGVAEDTQAGWLQSFAGRISTMASPQTTTLGAATLVPAVGTVKV